MEELKTCHQCRQRTTNRMTICKNLKERKPCTLKFCQRCLLNRYGEKVEEVEQLNDWKCPKCRNICNCSVCLKRKGNEPLGKFTRAVRDKGYSSVSDLLSMKPKEYLKPTGAGQDAATTTSQMETPVLPSRKQESASNEVFKEKREMKRKKSKWSSKFTSLRPFLNEENEISNEGIKEETVKSDAKE